MPGAPKEELKAEPAWPSIRPAGFMGASLALVALIARAPSAHADEGSGRLAPNSVYAEGFGAGLADSLNYERIVGDRFALRAGVGMLFGGATYGNSGAHGPVIAFPITVSYVGVHTHMHALEMGGGVTLADSFIFARLVYVYAMSNGLEPFGVAFIGYRFHPEGHAGFQLRVGAMALVGNGFALSGSDPPNFGDAARFGVIPWGYISVGASF